MIINKKAFFLFLLVLMPYTSFAGFDQVNKEIIPYQPSVIDHLSEKLFWVKHNDFKDGYDVFIPVMPYRQRYPLSCECAATKVVANYSGFADFGEKDCLEGIEFYEGPITGNLWGDPNEKFVGSVYGSQRNLTGWGVYAPPLVNMLEKKSIPAKAKYSASIEDISKELLKGNPVVVWVTTGLGKCHSVTWSTPEDRLINTCVNEHAIVVNGFTGAIDAPKTIRIMDVYYGNNKEYELWQFLKAWEPFGKMMLKIN